MPADDQGCLFISDPPAYLPDFQDRDNKIKNKDCRIGKNKKVEQDRSGDHPEMAEIFKGTDDQVIDKKDGNKKNPSLYKLVPVIFPDEFIQFFDQYAEVLRHFV
jgi:hypothetical protein